MAKFPENPGDTARPKINWHVALKGSDINIVGDELLMERDPTQPDHVMVTIPPKVQDEITLRHGQGDYALSLIHI